LTGLARIASGSGKFKHQSVIALLRARFTSR